MKRKKDKMDSPQVRKQIVLAFWIAAILVIIDALRYFIILVVNSYFNNEVLAEWIAFGIAIFILAVFINGFSKK